MELQNLSETEGYNKKITKSWDIDDYEILTDMGYTGLEYLYETIEYDVYELKTDKHSLKCADNHIVFTENMDEVFVIDLEVGDIIIGDGEREIVVSVKYLGYKEIMYDFELENNSNKRYYTNGILSHNTQLCKILAEHMFEGRDSLIRIDMSEYMEKFAITRLIGSPPGYVGHEEGGQLTEAVRRKPYSVVLLDEIEKAHEAVFNILLQVLDEGHLTDSLGRKVDFKNTIIIMTSNIGVKNLRDFGTGVGFQTKSKTSQRDVESKKVIEKAMKKYFAPEFINRVDDTIIFNSLDREHLNEIVKLELKFLEERINKLGFKVSFTQKAIDFISEKGFDPQYGARPLKRSIQKFVEDPVAEEMINNPGMKEGDIKITHLKDTDELKVVIKKRTNRKAKEQ